MNILVINGSPKGNYSITVKTAEYLEILHPEHKFSFFNAGQQIKALERNFEKAEKALKNADLIIFSYPVYTFIAPSQLHRFIELIKENNVNISGKYATQITTSKHFYDVTAHRYIQDNCFDLGLKYIKGLSADMDDLPTPQGQKDAQKFFDYVMYSIENNRFEKKLKIYSDISLSTASPVICEKEKTGDVVIIADLSESDTVLADMIGRFRAKLPFKTRIFNIREYPFKGGCLGCLNCSATGKCVYKDNFEEHLRNSIQTADSIIYAFTIKDHSMGSRFKMYDDRLFCNGHRTVTMGMPVGYIINGHISLEENLRMIIEGRAEVGHNFLCGIASNEGNADESIDTLADTLEYALNKKMLMPQNFYGIGGMRIFRDLIYLMQGMMKEDHKFFKAHGQYDFPQKKKGTMLLMYLVGAMFSNEKIKSKMGNKMNEGMIMPYKKVLNEAKNQNN